MANFFSKLFGSRNQRLLRNYSKVVSAAGTYAESFEQLSDQDVRAKTDEFRGKNLVPELDEVGIFLWLEGFGV